MTSGKAIDLAVLEGRRVRRRCWRADMYLELTDGHLVLHGGTRTPTYWVPSGADLVADDWELAT
jgi:hypothetical protein